MFLKYICYLYRLKLWKTYPAGNYMFKVKVNNRNTGTKCEVCSKLTIKAPERHQWQVIAGWVPIRSKIK